MDNSWIKISRKLTSWEWYQESKMVHIYVHLLIKANHKPKVWRGTLIERGQLITGRKVLAIELNMSEQSVRTCLNRLKKTGEIIITPTNKFSLITIVKYDDHQSSDDVSNQPTNQPSTKKQPSINQPSTTNNNSNNINNKRIKEYSSSVKQTFDTCLKFFPIDIHPKEKDIDKWIDTIDKLNRIDGYSFKQIINLIKWTRNDDWWKPNFLSITKLRKNNGDGVKYYKVFEAKMNNGKDLSEYKKYSHEDVARMTDTDGQAFQKHKAVHDVILNRLVWVHVDDIAKFNLKQHNT